MGRDTLGYIFKEVSKSGLEVAIAEIPGATIKQVDEFKNYGSYTSGNISIEYKGHNLWINVFVRKETDEYFRIFPQYTNGFEDTIKHIPNYGKKVSNIVLSGHCDAIYVEIIENILKKFGGVLIPDDCSNTMTYIKGVAEEKIIYPTIRNVPDVVLRAFIKTYMKSGDISKINNRLKTKIKGSDLFKEFVIRNIDK